MSLIYEVYEVLQLDEKADVKAMMADFDQEKLANILVQTYMEAFPDLSEEDKARLPKDAADHIGPFIEEEIKPKVRAIESIWKREDRVVWGIKYLKLGYLYFIFETFHLDPTNYQAENKTLSAEQTKAAVMKFNFAKKMAKQTEDFDKYFTQFEAGNYIAVNNAINNISRYFSLHIDSVDAFVFQSNLNLTDLIAKLNELVEEHQKQWQGWIEIDEDAGETIFKDYPSDKMAWVNLNRSACGLEGDSMGHCGNNPRSSEDDIMYSLSTIKKRHDGVTFRKPHVTAVIEDDGYWSEIKGRGNDKPHPKYGKFLVDIMIMDGVAGMKAPNWEPEGNWNWEDFDEDQQAYIIQQNPDFEVTGDKSPARAFIQGGDYDESELLQELRSVHTTYIDIQDVSGSTIIVKYSDDLSDVWNMFDTESYEAILNVYGNIPYPEAADDDDGEAEALHDIRVEAVNGAMKRAIGEQKTAEAIYEIIVTEDDVEVDNVEIFRHLLDRMTKDDGFKKTLYRNYSEIIDQKEFSFISDNLQAMRVSNAIYRDLSERGVKLDFNQVIEDFINEAAVHIAEEFMENIYVEPAEDLEELPIAYTDLIREHSDFDEYMIDDLVGQGMTYADAIVNSMDRSLMDELDGNDISLNLEQRRLRPVFDYFFDTKKFIEEHPKAVDNLMVSLGDKIRTALKKNR